MQSYLHKNNKKLIFLIFIGLTLSLFLKFTLNPAWKIFLSDLFFCLSIVFLLYGFWEFVLKVGFFNSLIFGSKHLKDIVFSNEDKSFSTEEDYITFISTRKKERDILVPMLMGGVLLVIAILIPIII